MNTNAILIVEDEKNLGDTLSEYLRSIGHDCYKAENCQQAREIFRDQHPSVVLMDIGLPDGDGITLAEEFRNKRKDFVLLFLSAQNDPETRVKGLEIGAEDYITKPFALKEITLRLERILKTQNHFDILPEVITHGDLKIWFKRFEVEDAQGNITSLSRKECEILELLYQNKNQSVNRNTIIQNIWCEERFPSNRTVDNYIVKLRKWCDTDENHILQIKSIRGIGYRLVLNPGEHNGTI
ncbi:MAG: response regulator transcription factor [Deltaproteobacteria bacterium]|nr:MAG: response regulator transcription factor [Deltaproteobacteria bacterium]